MIAVIGGSGLNELSNLKVVEEKTIATPYGNSSVISRGNFAESSAEALFLPRHGEGHHLPPHLINYRANLWAINNLGATHVLAVNAVGGIRQDMKPGTLVLPDQIIDYTYGREHTFFTGDDAGVDHIDFTEPYDRLWRNKVLQAAAEANIAIIGEGVYACTQGPRLESAAEIRKLQRDGCDVVGMTGMPEAALARELTLSYAAINLVVNWGAGLSHQAITMEMIMAELDSGMERVRRLIVEVAKHYGVEGQA